MKEHVQRQKVGECVGQLSKIAFLYSTSLNLPSAGYFVGGFSTCLLLAGGVVLVRRFTFPSPDRLLERVMPMLRANSEVRSILGESGPGSFACRRRGTMLAVQELCVVAPGFTTFISCRSLLWKDKLNKSCQEV